jgi:5-methylcytosine-specific restriction endonuclease McrA
MTAWRGSTRRYRLPPDWKKRRQVVLARDGYRCTWVENGVRCPRPATDVDHIRPGDDHSLTNLRSLCRQHHLSKSGREGRAAHRPRPSRLRPQPPHPGLIEP